jgi:glycosyltransferase involved in cell wall biosynthesis
MKFNVSAVILVYNEELHLERCLKSLVGVVDEVFVVDSYSNDKSLEIARKYHVKIYRNKWENSYSKQFNWGLKNLPISGRWILRIDADEILEEDFRRFILYKMNKIPLTVSGIYVNRRIKFMGKKIKYGGKQIEWQLRLFRNGKGICERRWMDEHIKLLDGGYMKVNIKLTDDNLNDLTWWIDKHNKYAIREALDVLNYKYKFRSDLQLESKLYGNQAERKRFFKEHYNKLPIFIGPFLYFLYRYILQFGFLDGRRGFIFHFLQGLWYRFLVQVKTIEIEQSGRYNADEIIEVFNHRYNITTDI